MRIKLEPDLIEIPHPVLDGVRVFARPLNAMEFVNSAGAFWRSFKEGAQGDSPRLPAIEAAELLTNVVARVEGVEFENALGEVVPFVSAMAPRLLGAEFSYTSKEIRTDAKTGEQKEVEGQRFFFFDILDAIAAPFAETAEGKA